MKNHLPPSSTLERLKMFTNLRQYGQTLAMGLRKPALALLLGVSALPAAALADAPDSVTTTTGDGIGAPMVVNSLLPVVNNDSEGNNEAISLLFRPLLWIGAKLKIDWADSVAKSIQVSDKDTTFTITLKHWQWSDGKPVTAADAAYGYRLIKDYGQRYPNYGIGGMPEIVKSVEVLGANRLRVVLKHPVNPTWFELNNLSQVIPLPESAWKGYSVDYLFAHQTDPALVKIVDGPYRLQSFSQGRQVSFVANSRYSGHKPKIEHFVLKMYTSSANAFSSLKTGELQIANVPQALYAARRMVANLKSLHTHGSFGIFYVPLNFTNPRVAFFHELHVRQALQYAIDEPLMIKIAFHGLGTPGFGPVPTYPETYLSPKLRAMVAHPRRMYDPAKARKLLDEAGWKPGPDGIRVKDGQRLVFTLLLPSGTEMEVEAADLLKENWRAIGVDMKIHTVPFNQEIAKLRPHGDWDAALISWSYNPNFYPTGGGLFDTGGGSNYGGYSDPTMDRLIHASTVQKGLKSLFAYENYAAEQLPVLYLPNPGYLVKYDPRLTGMHAFYLPSGAYAPEYLAYRPH